MKIKFTGILLLLCWQLTAQERIDTDRPDQTESSAIVPKGWFQAEIGFQIDKEGKNRQWLHPSALWKYGLAKWIELRLITEMTTLDLPGSIAGRYKETGFLPLQFGVKVKLFEEKGIIPQTSLIMHNSFSSIASEKFRDNKWAPNFRFVMSNDISRNISLGYNLGAEWDGETTKPRWLYTFAPALNVGEKWRVYVESYGYWGSGHAPDHNLAGGIIYFLTPDVQFDLSPSFGLTEAAVDRYITVGLSFRFR
jgi:hypothetical protein